MLYCLVYQFVLDKLLPDLLITVALVFEPHFFVTSVTTFYLMNASLLFLFYGCVSAFI